MQMNMREYPTLHLDPISRKEGTAVLLLFYISQSQKSFNSYPKISVKWLLFSFADKRCIWAYLVPA